MKKQSIESQNAKFNALLNRFYIYTLFKSEAFEENAYHQIDCKKLIKDSQSMSQEFETQKRKSTIPPKLHLLHSKMDLFKVFSSADTSFLKSFALDKLPDECLSDPVFQSSFLETVKFVLAFDPNNFSHLITEALKEKKISDFSKLSIYYQFYKLDNPWINKLRNDIDYNSLLKQFLNSNRLAQDPDRILEFLAVTNLSIGHAILAYQSEKQLTRFLEIVNVCKQYLLSQDLIPAIKRLKYEDMSQRFDRVNNYYAFLKHNIGTIDDLIRIIPKTALELQVKELTPKEANKLSGRLLDLRNFLLKEFKQFCKVLKLVPKDEKFGLNLSIDSSQVVTKPKKKKSTKVARPSVQPVQSNVDIFDILPQEDIYKLDENLRDSAYFALYAADRLIYLLDPCPLDNINTSPGFYSNLQAELKHLFVPFMNFAAMHLIYQNCLLHNCDRITDDHINQLHFYYTWGTTASFLNLYIERLEILEKLVNSLDTKNSEDKEIFSKSFNHDLQMVKKNYIEQNRFFSLYVKEANVSEEANLLKLYSNS